MLVKNDSEHQLGWRIVMEIEKPENYCEIIKQSYLDGKELFSLTPKIYKNNILKRASEFIPKQNEETNKVETDIKKPTIKFVTFEGAKGLSAQHVFILGLQNGDLPRQASNIRDIELCKFLVALTRTRKQCHILCTTNFAGLSIALSRFVEWLARDYIQLIKINKSYWNN